MNGTVNQIFLCCLICAGCCIFVSGQTEEQTRSIKSDDFVSQRPAGKKKSASKKYAFRRKGVKIVRKSTKRRSPKTTAETAKIQELGVTIWKLRPGPVSRGAFAFPVQVGERRQQWVAERTDQDTKFAAGDRVRLAVESSVKGFLYVVNSEIHDGERYGEPYLIFPSDEKEDNSVLPGLLVDIPDKAEDLPYFLISPKKDDYVGELVTIIVSPNPIKELKTDREGRITSVEYLADLESESEVEIFTRNDLSDKIYSTSEAEASCGAKSRALVREKNAASPCGNDEQRLTRDDALPQTIYRVKAKSGEPIVAFVRLFVK